MKLPTPLILFASLALATSAMAKIGETYGQVHTEARQDRDTVAMRVVNWQGRTALLVQYRNGDIIRHVFGTNNREIAFYWWADHRITDREIGIVMRILRTRWHATQSIGPRWSNWLSDVGRLAMGVDGSNYLCILDLNRLNEIPGGDDSQQQRAAADAPPPSSLSKSDCLIVATEAYARLSKTAHWSRVSAFMWVEDGKPVGKHAVVFYQPSADSNIFMYDRNGSQDLRTQSHDLTAIISALNQITPGSLYAQSPQWLNGEDDASTATTTREQRGNKFAKDVVDAAEKHYEEWKRKNSESQALSRHFVYAKEEGLHRVDTAQEGDSAQEDSAPAVADATPAPVSTPVMTGAVGHSVSANVHAIADDINTVLIVAVVIGFGVMLRYGGIRLWPIAILSEPVYLIIEAIRANRRRKT